MVKRNLGVLALATVLSIGAVPAFADSAFFSFSVGDHGSSHRGYGSGYSSRHDSWGHGYGRHHYYERERFNSWGPPSFFAPRPIVYYQEPTVIERRVIIEEPVIRASRGRVVSNSPYCREYQRNVTVGNRVQESYGTACRQPDGAWKVVQEDE